MIRSRLALRNGLKRLLLCGALTLGCPWVVAAADPAFVGILATAVDPEVAKQIELDPEKLQQLLTLIDKREAAAVDLALQIKDLPPAERDAKLKPFVDESERLGIVFLTPLQRTKVMQIRIARAGLASLGEPEVALRVRLTDEQKGQVAELLKGRTAELARGTSSDREAARAKYERDLAALLTVEQRAKWESLAGLAANMAEAMAKQAAAEEAEKGGADDAAAKPAMNADRSKPTTDVVPSKPGERQGTPVVLGPDGERKLRFNFRYAPWKDVLDWFATQADLSLVLDAPPPGTFNYTDTRTYSPEEAIDILNGVLLTKGYVLLRRERMVLLLNLEDEVPDPLVELVTPQELDKRGRFELVRCLFPLKKLTPEDAEKEIAKLIGPQGKVMTLSQSKQLLVRETAGRLRAIRDLIAAVEDPEANRNEKLTVVQLQNMTTDELLLAARPLLGLPENINAAPDGSLRISPDPLNARLLVSGKPERIEKLEEIIKLLDVPTDRPTDPTAAEQPQLEIYTMGGADSNAVLQVLQTILAGASDVRLAIDPKTGNIVALAKPSQHATIKATLTEMQKDASDIEVFLLRRVDPQVVTVAINKLYGGDEKSPGAGAPKVDSDPTTRQLFVRGTPAQIAQVKTLLSKMGEGETVSPGEETIDRGNVRTLPITGRSADSVLQQLETLWPTVRANRIRIVRPSSDGDSSSIRVKKIDGDAPAAAPSTREIPPELLELRRMFQPDLPLEDLVPRKPSTPKAKDAAPPGDEEKPSEPPKPAAPRNAGERPRHSIQLAAWQPPSPPPSSAQPPAPQPPAPPAGGEVKPETPVGEKPADVKKPVKRYIPPVKAGETTAAGDAAEIVISVQSTGIVIASQDKEALDAMEALLSTLSENAQSSGKEFTVYYLKYAPAGVAGALVQEILGGGGGDSGGGGGAGGGLLGDLASGMLGDMGGGLLGSLMGGGGGGGGGGLQASGPIAIVSDARLNALFVRATPMDLELVEDLLKIIDQEASPENVQTSAPPRFIPVFNSSAEEIAAVVRQVYANRLTADNSQPRQPNPEDFLRALRGGGRGGRDNAQNAKSEPAKITVGVDARSNSLIVSAPEPLFVEIKAMVEQLDEAADSNRDQAMRVLTIKSASPQVIQRALNSMTGGKARSGSATTPAGAPAATPGAAPAAPSGGFQPAQMQDEIRRRIESFNMQQGGGGGGRGGFGGFPGGGGGGGFGGGRGGRGGR
ncbi:MAG: secretin N-terminal domain-containing protein [Pirellulales bacterium]